MEEESNPSLNSRIFPLFMGLLLITGAYCFEDRRIRTLSNASKKEVAKERPAYYIISITKKDK